MTYTREFLPPPACRPGLGSAFTNNSTGIFQQFGPIFSRGNNTVSGNTNNLSGTLTPLGGM